MVSPFQQIVGSVDLKVALTRGAESNDLLPPRPEDNVRGEVGNRFSEALKRDLERGVYDPDHAYFVQVPKSNHSTRPAALMNLADRVVYEALVAALRPRIESALLGKEIVFWPRGAECEKGWRTFEQSPLTGNYVVIADVSAFYESIDHEELAERLIRLTGRRSEAEALLELLNRVMASRKGLPQGVAPSDPLATAYFAQVDYAMVRDGFRYSRHGDDIRIAVSSYDAARHAILTLEERVREAGLQLNGAKSKILKRATYASELRSIDETIAETRRKLVDARVQELEEDSTALVSAIEAADKEELGWDFFYHGHLSLHEVIDELRPHLEPDDGEIAERLFQATIQAAPGSPNALPSDAFHQRLVSSLVRLAAIRSPVPLRHIGKLLKTYPDKTELFCSYLAALADTSPVAVARQITLAFLGGKFRTEWESAWLTRTLARVPQRVSAEVLKLLKGAVEQPRGMWLYTVEAAKLLAARGELSRDTLVWLWNTCPRIFRADLVVAAAALSSSQTWAEAFVMASQDDPIHRVVAKQFERATKSARKAKS